MVNYEFDIKYKLGKNNQDADGLSLRGALLHHRTRTKSMRSFKMKNRFLGKPLETLTIL